MTLANTIPSVWIIMRFTGNGFRDPTPEEKRDNDSIGRIDNGIPRFLFEGPEDAFTTEEDAEAAATLLMEKDGVHRWVFKSVSSPDIKKVNTFNPTNGGRKLRSVP